VERIAPAALGRAGRATDGEGGVSDAFDEGYDDDPIDDDEYVDEIAVERRCNGDHTVTLNRAEVRAAFERLSRQPLSAQEVADRLGVTSRSVVRWRNGHTGLPYGLNGAGMTTPATSSPIALLLEQASGHGNRRVRNLAEKIESHLADLRDLMAQDVEREKARQEVADLERRLAEARAKLRGGTTATATPREPGAPDGRTAPLPCRKGCGKVCSGGQGRAAHERNCAHQAAA
jgi:transcriptional regulator with XRE-family HTH domain